MKKSLHYNDIAHPIEASPTQLKQFGELVNPFDPKYYISKFKSDMLEENKLAFKSLENNQDIVDKWSLWSENDQYSYWLNGDTLFYLSDYYNNNESPKNIFLETIEFDWPGIGSADERYPNSIDPTPYQVGRGRQLLCKYKETLINYYTEGKAVYQNVWKHGRKYANCLKSAKFVHGGSFFKV